MKKTDMKPGIRMSAQDIDLDDQRAVLDALTRRSTQPRAPRQRSSNDWEPALQASSMALR